MKTTCEENVSAEFAAAMKIHIQFLNKCSTDPEINNQEEEIANAMAGTLKLIYRELAENLKLRLKN